MLTVHIIIAIFCVLGIFIADILGRIADSQNHDPNWNSPANKPKKIGEYLTRFQLGKIQVIEMATWNGKQWTHVLHNKTFEVYCQAREWRVAA